MMIKFYGSVSCGVAEHHSGQLLKKEDVKEMINKILDDEENSVESLRKCSEYLDTEFDSMSYYSRFVISKDADGFYQPSLMDES